MSLKSKEIKMATRLIKSPQCIYQLSNQEERVILPTTIRIIIYKDEKTVKFKICNFSKADYLILTNIVTLIFLDIFWTNLHSPVSRHVAVHPRYIWNLFRRLIICIEQASIYINTFPNTLTSEWAKNHEISTCFSTNAFVALCHAPSLFPCTYQWRFWLWLTL